MLDSTLLEQALKTLNVTPDTDLFATRLNSQCEKFVSYKLEPGALAIDAFTLIGKILICIPSHLLVLSQQYYKSCRRRKHLAL